MRSFVLLVVFSFLPCSRRLLRRLAAVFGGAAGARMSAQFLPVILTHVDAVMLGGFPDIGEGQFAVLVGNSDAMAFLTWLASVIGSLRCFGKANTLSGKSLRSVSSPCFSWGFQVVFIDLTSLYSNWNARP